MKSPDAFAGFFTGDGHRTPIPNAFFDVVVPRESLSVIKVVGTVLRHTFGYQNQFGGRRSSAPLSDAFIRRHARMSDRTSVSQAIRTAADAGYIKGVSAGVFHPSQTTRCPARYTVR